MHHVLLVFACLAAPLLAHASPDAAPVPADGSETATVVALVLGVAALVVRRLAPREHWMQSRAALVLVALVAGGLDTAAQAVIARGLHLLPIAVAVLSAALAQLDPRPGDPAPRLADTVPRPNAGGGVGLLLLASLALGASSCAPGWQQRTADRIDCYGPLVDRAVGLILDAVHDPARALLGAVDLYREVRATLGEPDVRTCALHRLAAMAPKPDPSSGARMGSGDRLQDVVRAGLAIEGAGR